MPCSLPASSIVVQCSWAACSLRECLSAPACEVPSTFGLAQSLPASEVTSRRGQRRIDSVYWESRACSTVYSMPGPPSRTSNLHASSSMRSSRRSCSKLDDDARAACLRYLSGSLVRHRVIHLAARTSEWILHKQPVNDCFHERRQTTADCVLERLQTAI